MEYLWLFVFIIWLSYLTYIDCEFRYKPEYEKHMDKIIKEMNL